MSATPFHPGTPALTERDLRDFRIVVVHYWAEWNPGDRKMSEVLRQVRKEFEGRIAFRSCDTDNSANKPFFNTVSNVPAMGCFLDGQWFDVIIGFRDAAEVRRALDLWGRGEKATSRSETDTARFTGEADVRGR